MTKIKTLKTIKEKKIKHAIEELYILPKIMIEDSIDKLRKHADNCDLFSLSRELEFTSGFTTAMSIHKEISEKEYNNYKEEIELIINRSETLCKCSKL